MALQAPGRSARYRLPQANQWRSPTLSPTTAGPRPSTPAAEAPCRRGNGAARRDEISAAEGIERVTRITYDAEFVALTQLQADVFVTSDGDLARAVSALVQTATIGVLDAA